MNKPYAAAHFALELDGKQDVGLFRSIEGGGVKADVMTYQYGHAYEKWRSLGKPKFEDMKLQVGMSMSKPFYDWISAFFDGTAVPKQGAIVAADFYYNERARRKFSNAMIKELTFPKLEAKDTSPIFMSIAVSVEGMEFAAGNPKQKVMQNKGFNQQKEWTANRFRLSLDGFDDACRNCTKIDSFTIKQNIIEYHAGGFRAPMKVGSQVDFPTISFYVPEADAEPFFKHFTKNAINGEGRMRNGASKRTGYIQTYDNEGSPLFNVEFYEGDICNVQIDKADTTNEEAKLVKIDLFTERMKFEYTAFEVV